METQNFITFSQNYTQQSKGFSSQAVFDVSSSQRNAHHKNSLIFPSGNHQPQQAGSYLSNGNKENSNFFDITSNFGSFKIGSQPHITKTGSEKKHTSSIGQPELTQLAQGFPLPSAPTSSTLLGLNSSEIKELFVFKQQQVNGNSASIMNFLNQIAETQKDIQYNLLKINYKIESLSICNNNNNNKNNTVSDADEQSIIDIYTDNLNQKKTSSNSSILNFNYENSLSANTNINNNHKKLSEIENEASSICYPSNNEHVIEGEVIWQKLLEIENEIKEVRTKIDEERAQRIQLASNQQQLQSVLNSEGGLMKFKEDMSIFIEETIKQNIKSLEQYINRRVEKTESLLEKFKRHLIKTLHSQPQEKLAPYSNDNSNNLSDISTAFHYENNNNNNYVDSKNKDSSNSQSQLFATQAANPQFINMLKNLQSSRDALLSLEQKK